MAAFLTDSFHDLPKAFGGLGLRHPFGHDAFGRDLLLTTLRASFNSFRFATVATLLCLFGGLLLGAILAMTPPLPRRWAQSVLDFFLSFPSLLLALGLAALWGPGTLTLTIAILIGSLPAFVRLMYFRSREILASDYIEATQAMGGGSVHVLRVHLIPELLSFARLKIPNFFAQALLAEATLTFLGIGASAGEETWGALLAQSRDVLLEYPRIAFCSGLPLILTVLSLQLLFSEPENARK